MNEIKINKEETEKLRESIKKCKEIWDYINDTIDIKKDIKPNFLGIEGYIKPLPEEIEFFNNQWEGRP